MLGQSTGVSKAISPNPLAQKAQFLVTKARLGRQAELTTELCVVAQFRVRIQRQVVGNQVDVVSQQQAQALLQPACDSAILPPPKQAVMHQEGVCLHRDRSLDQGQTGGNARDQAVHCGRALDLQPVRAVVLEARSLQQILQRLHQLAAVCHGAKSVGWSVAGRSGRRDREIVGEF